MVDHPRDAVAKVASATICGSDDLHLYDGYIPAIENRGTLGHEFMVDVVEVGSENWKLRACDRAVVPFSICSGSRRAKSTGAGATVTCLIR